MPHTDNSQIQTTPCQAILVACANPQLALDWLVKEILFARAQHPKQQLAVIWDGDLQPPALSRLGTVAVQTLLAGCVCCVGGPVLKSAIVKILRTSQPNILWIIGGPSAMLSAMAQAVQSPLLATHIIVAQTVWLAQPGSSANHAFDQIECASLGVNTNLLSFDVATHPWVPQAALRNPANLAGQRASQGADQLWSADAIFDRKMVLSVFENFSEVITIKYRLDGIFRTQRDHYYGASVNGNLNWRDTSWRLDSRMRLTAVDTKTIVVTLQTLREQFEACRTQ